MTLSVWLTGLVAGFALPHVVAAFLGMSPQAFWLPQAGRVVGFVGPAAVLVLLARRSAGLGGIQPAAARAVNRVFGRKGPVLLGRYHVRVLSSPREVRNALRYVLLNARKHWAKRNPGRTRAPGLDEASSGRWFDGWKHRPWPEPAPEVPEVAQPHYWVTSTGWRRHRLIDPAEIPGRA